MLRTALGPAIAQYLEDPAVVEVMLNPDGRLWVDRLREGLVATDDVLIPSDGEIIEGVASVDESAITGESAPVIRESGGDRSAVTGGTQVISDWIVVRITAAAGSTFIDRMIALVEGAQRQKTPNEIALNILLAGMTIIFVFATATIPSFATYAGGSVPVVILVALFVTLIPTTIGALLSAIGIAGMDRLVRFNVLAKSGRAVEAAGDIDVLLLDHPDLAFNEFGARGIGEIGITGTGAAVANAIYNATGRRIRDLPITLDKLLVPSLGS